MRGELQSYEPYKYVLQELTAVHIGACYTYGELMDNDEIPFKLRAVFSHYMLKEVADSTTIGDHVFYMKEQDLSYLAYKQMKAKFRLNVWREAGETDEDGRTVKKSGYESRSYGIDEITGNAYLKSRMDSIVVEELSFKKFALMSVGL